MSRYSLETRYEVWDDDSGSRIEIGPDRDGLDLVEMRYRESEGGKWPSLTFTREQLPLVIAALQKMLTEGEK